MHTAHLRGVVGMSSLMISDLRDPMNELQRLTSPSLIISRVVDLVNKGDEQDEEGRS